MSIDAEVTEVWINVHIDGLQEYAQYIVTRDDSIIYSNIFNQSDFIVHDIDLLPGKSYMYKAYAKMGKEISDTIETTIITMDSTISNFNINNEIIPHAQFTHCRIWNPDSYWIIGEYRPKDSSGAYLGFHNILSYENEKWSNISVKYEAGWSSPLSITENTGFWAFEKNNVWFALYDIRHWTGGVAQTFYDGHKRHTLFGFDNNELYATSGKSPILRIINNEIEKINLPENFYITDWWGDSENNLGLTILDHNKKEPVLLFIKDGKIDEEIRYKPSILPFSLWFKTKKKIFLADDNINILNRDRSLINFDLDNITYVTKMRGTDINNVFAITWCGKVFHFNGVRWKLIYHIPMVLNDIQVTDNLILIVGSDMFYSCIIKITN